MTTTEDRLTTALNARADQVRPEDLTYQSPPAAPRSLSRVPRTAAFALVAAAAVAAVAVPFVLGGASQRHQLQPGHQPGPGPSSPSHVRAGGKTLSENVFYGRQGSNSLVSRPVEIPDRGNPMLRALEFAAQEPTEAGLIALVPADSISEAGLDGFGRYGSFSLTLSDRAWVQRPSTMGVTEARLAQRAVLCMVQSFGGLRGGHQPVHVYPPSGTTEVDRLFGIPLPPTHGHVMDVDCS